MRKISKKDRVRQFTNPVWMLRLLAVFMCSNVISVTFSQDAIEKTPAYMDSVEISLLTCSPHEEIYSLYGHTALRCHDLHAGMEQDMVLNWGQFDFNTPYFVPRFIFGLTDYQLGVEKVMPFCEYYRYWGSSVTEQVLNLTAEEKDRLYKALKDNLKPENITYRYNIFYNNCSTLPRDIIERCVSGKMRYNVRQDYVTSFREMLHEKARNHRWTMFGTDMLLGLRADLKTTRQEQEFLPENLLYDFDHAQIQSNADNSLRPLVSQRRMLVPPGVQMVEQDFPLTPTECALCLLVVTMGLTLGEWKQRWKAVCYWDAALMLLTGLAGCVLTMMLFSQHPTTTLNLQVLLVNPIHLFYIPATLRHRKSRYPAMLAVMLVLLAIGALFQHYAEGLLILALCLLIRLVARLVMKKDK